jgi:GNAT superfamily N-acetyltransferase
MQIEEYTVDDTAVVAEVVALARAVQETDSPWVHPTTTTTLTGMLRYGWDGEKPRVFVARDQGRVVGAANYWTSEWDNKHLAWLGVEVHPAHRRTGVGTALLDTLTELARAEGRSMVGIDGWDNPTTLGFAAAHGFEKGSQAIQRRQVLADIDRDVLQKLYDEAAHAAVDYELVRLVGPTPDDLIDQVVVMTASINDAPTDDLDIEDEVFTAERVRGYENAIVGKRQRAYHLVARHRTSGELAGHTIVTVELERPAIGHQHDTSVIRAHRGHRLGLLLKSAMLLWLAEAEPQLETVETWNAESNDHMIAVNEQLGYRVLGREIQFQRTL